MLTEFASWCTYLLIAFLGTIIDTRTPASSNGGLEFGVSISGGFWGQILYGYKKVRFQQVT